MNKLWKVDDEWRWSTLPESFYLFLSVLLSFAVEIVLRRHILTRTLVSKYEVPPPLRWLLFNSSADRWITSTDYKVQLRPIIIMFVIALTLLIILMILLALGCDKLHSLPLPRSDGMVVIPQPTSFPRCGGWCLDKVTWHGAVVVCRFCHYTSDRQFYVRLMTFTTEEVCTLKVFA